MHPPPVRHGGPVHPCSPRASTRVPEECRTYGDDPRGARKATCSRHNRGFPPSRGRGAAGLLEWMWIVRALESSCLCWGYGSQRRTWLPQARAADKDTAFRRLPSTTIGAHWALVRSGWYSLYRRRTPRLPSGPGGRTFSRTVRKVRPVMGNGATSPSAKRKRTRSYGFPCGRRLYQALRDTRLSDAEVVEGRQEILPFVLLPPGQLHWQVICGSGCHVRIPRSGQFTCGTLEAPLVHG